MRAPALSDRPFAAEPGGVRLAVRLTPRADRDRVDGIVADPDGRPRLHLRVCAPPVEGAANQALVAYLANSLSLRKSDVEIRAGETARQKTLFLHGDPALLLARLERWVAG